MATNINEDHRRAFNALTSGKYNNFALVSCFVNGEPTCAISVVTKDGDDYLITPLFVAVTPGMELVDHGGVTAASNS